MATKTFSKCDISIYIWILQVIIILGLASLAIWASLIPKTPTFTISNLDFKPHQNASADLVRSSSLTLNVTISNPNKLSGVYFDEINVRIRCKNESVGSRSVPVSGFYLGRRRSDLKEVDLDVNGLLCGKVDLRVELETGVRYKTMWVKTERKGLVFEDYVQIGSDGQAQGTREMKLS